MSPRPAIHRFSITLVACALIASGCGPLGGQSGSSKCQLHLAPGEIPSVDEVLPPRDECPKLYKGRPGAPPVNIPQPVSPGSPPERKNPYDDNPCLHPSSLNGHPCYDDPSGPVYVPPVPNYAPPGMR